MAPRSAFKNQDRALIILTLALLLSFETSAETLTCEKLFSKRRVETTFKADRDLVQDNVDGVVLPSKRHLLGSVNTLLQNIEVNYGPRIWKMATQSGTTAPQYDQAAKRWAIASKDLRNSVKYSITDIDQVFENVKFLFKMNDGHVSVELNSTYAWNLPMEASFDPVTNKFSLTFIDRALAQKQVLTGELPPLGAELVKVDGKSPEDFQKSFVYFTNDGNRVLNASTFGQKLFSMEEGSGIPLSRMSNDGRELTFRWTDEKNQLIERSVKLKYIESGKKISELSTILDPAVPDMGLSIDQKLKAFKLFIKGAASGKSTPRVSALEEQNGHLHSLFKTEVSTRSENIIETDTNRMEGRRYLLGQRDPLFTLPQDFKPLQYPNILLRLFPKNDADGNWIRDELPIIAGTFMDNGKRIGFVRIPRWNVMDPLTAQKLIDYTVEALEKNSDHLIVDEMHNPGGSATYVEQWVYGLSGKFDPSKHLGFQVKPTDHFIDQFRQNYDRMNTNSTMVPDVIRRPLLDALRKQFEIVQNARMAGMDLSPPITLLPVTQMYQVLGQMAKSKTSVKALFSGMTKLENISIPFYTKGITLITDRFCFSGADAFAAIMSDTGRATLVGEPTAGAGGTVEKFTDRSLNAQYSYHMTTSLMYRFGNPSQRYVENNGVQPHVLLYPTPEDYTNGMQSYFPRVLEVVRGQIAKGHN